MAVAPRRPRVMIVAATTAYQTEEFVRAAHKLDVQVVVASDRCATVAGFWQADDGPLALDFRTPSRAAAAIVAAAAEQPVHGIVGTDERSAYIAALAARELGLVGNEPEAVKAAGSKVRFRELATAAEIPQPRFERVAVNGDACAAANDIGYPVVIKPLHLSGSRGVMRANDDAELRLSCQRLGEILRDPDVRKRDPEAARWLLVESYLPGVEVAFEGLLRGGALETLAIFDKPDALEGPFFAETIYVTPSRQQPEVQQAIGRAVADAARALGLGEGPVHAELRIDAGGQPVVLEVAARSIGGLCARTLRFGAGISLEELVMAHAMGRPFAAAERAHGASGVLMLPVPMAGVLQSIGGVDEVRALPAVSEVVISARLGDTVSPLPEGHTYMGFVFAAGDRSSDVTTALREAMRLIKFRIAPRLRVEG